MTVISNKPVLRRFFGTWHNVHYPPRAIQFIRSVIVGIVPTVLT